MPENFPHPPCSATENSEEPVSYFSQLQDKLSALDDEVAFHILNGILFEIYFDSHGRFRTKKKTDKLDDVFALEESPQFAKSFDFIRQMLMQYEKHVFYIPGRARDVLVDITNTDEADNKSTLQSISIEGQDVFYDADGETLASNADIQFYYSQTVAQFESGLASVMATPTRRLKLTYAHTPSPSAVLVVPYDYRIQKISV